MLGILYMTVCMACGCVMIRALLPRHSVLARGWLGCSLGVLLNMWMPALAAFAVGFTPAAHWIGLGMMAVLTFCVWLARDRRTVKPWDEQQTRLLKQLLLVALPLTILGGYLQYTHNVRIAVDGSWHVGQSTYGDLPMHMSFAAGLRNSAFPPDYPFYPGHRLSYPFLTDTLSTSFMLMGSSLQAALSVPGTVMMALCFAGVMILADQMTLGRKTVVLAALLFFLNGGLGFLYDFDQAAGVDEDGVWNVVDRIQYILTGFYKTPTNQPDPNNLRWSNVIADLMVPQRTLLGGWCLAIPCFYLLYTAFEPSKRQELGGLRPVLLLGVWAGALPLVHTHSFLALGLCTVGMMVYDLIHEKGRVQTLLRYLPFGCVTVLLAAPQLILFTFAQAFQHADAEGAGNTFLTLQFNWVNNPGGNGMRDFYLWFYIKNIGLPFLLLLGAAFERDGHMRRILAGALAIIVCAELIRFQPNEYDNNKLFYLAWMLCCMVVADFAARLWRRLKGIRARGVMAVFAAVVIFLSAGLTLWRECVSDYQAFSQGAVEAGAYIEENTDQHAVFLTGTQHLNPVCAIAGRQVVCGPDLWLYWHGFNTTQRKMDVRRFLTDPGENLDVIGQYDVDYVYISSYERNDYDVDEDWFEENWTCVFRNWEAAIYIVPEG